MSKEKGVKKLLRMLNKPVKQRTFCYCQVCKNELCSSDSFVKDTDYVYYKCSRCGSESVWDFDIAPAPILLKYQRLTKKLHKYIYTTNFSVTKEEVND